MGLVLSALSVIDQVLIVDLCTCHQEELISLLL